MGLTHRPKQLAHFFPGSLTSHFRHQWESARKPPSLPAPSRSRAAPSYGATPHCQPQNSNNARPSGAPKHNPKLPLPLVTMTDNATFSQPVINVQIQPKTCYRALILPAVGTHQTGRRLKARSFQLQYLGPQTDPLAKPQVAQKALEVRQTWAQIFQCHLLEMEIRKSPSPSRVSIPLSVK